jgi:regulator of extracellular matrix RemA (YlzA/DUF370 family)
MLIDATYGRRTRAVLITDSDHVILSAIQPETVANRAGGRDQAHDSGKDKYSGAQDDESDLSDD